MLVRFSREKEVIDVPRVTVALRGYFQAHGKVVAAYIHGSYATGHQTPLSDLDLAVLFPPGHHLEFRQELELLSELCEVAGEEDLNVILLRRVPPVLQYKVLSTGRLIYEGDPEAHSDFIELVIKRYGDFIIDFREFSRQYDGSLRRDYIR